MKRIALIMVGTVALGGALTYGPKLAEERKTLYEAAQAPQTIEIEKEVPTLEMRVKSAQEAEFEAVEAAAQAAYAPALNQAMLEIELECTAQFKPAIDDRAVELETAAERY